jgi:hypothetical protein
MLCVMEASWSGGTDCVRPVSFDACLCMICSTTATSPVGDGSMALFRSPVYSVTTAVVVVDSVDVAVAYAVRVRTDVKDATVLPLIRREESCTRTRMLT